VLDEERVQRHPVPLGDDLPQDGLGLLGAPGPGDPQPLGDPVHVGVDRHRRDAVAEDKDAVRGLRSDAGERGQRGEFSWDGPPEPLEQRLGARPDRAGLGVVEADRADAPLDFGDRRAREAGGVREPAEQRGRGDVGLLVPGTLREDRADEHLERVLRVVAEVRPAPVPRVVERREAVQEPLPVDRGRAGRRHRAGSRPATRRSVGRPSWPGSERSGSSLCPRGSRSSPTR